MNLLWTWRSKRFVLDVHYYFSVFISTSYSKDSRINVKYKLSIAMADWNKEIKQLSGHDELQLWDLNPLTHIPLTGTSSLFWFFSFIFLWLFLLQFCRTLENKNQCKGYWMFGWLQLNELLKRHSVFLWLIFILPFHFRRLSLLHLIGD